MGSGIKASGLEIAGIGITNDGQPEGWPSGDFNGLWRLLFMALGVRLSQRDDVQINLGGA